MVFSDRLRQLRMDRGYTQFRLGEMLNVSQRTIANWEGGARQPDLETICELSALFEVSADFLLGIVARPFRAVSDSDGSMTIYTSEGQTPILGPLQPQTEHVADDPSKSDMIFVSSDAVEALVTRLVEQALNKRFPPES